MGENNGMGHVDELDEGDELEVVEFEDEDGVVHTVAILAIVDVDGFDYAVLAPVAQLEDTDNDEPMEIFLFQYSEDEEGNEMFAHIEDEETFRRVQAEASAVLDLEAESDEA